MTDQIKQEKECKKGFFARLIEKFDKKIKEAADKSPCCGGGSEKDKGSGCC